MQRVFDEMVKTKFNKGLYLSSLKQFSGLNMSNCFQELDAAVQRMANNGKDNFN